jgi:NAD(P)-dependent dehydrogenase (short-subunit alcohol dehydrogenase family)
LEKELGSERAVFIHCDTTSYASQLTLFKTAIQKWGRIDIAVANAGISLPADPFSADADIEKEFSTAEIDVNLKGPLITSRIGLHFLRKNGREGGDLILVSSIAGWKECTGLVAYTASKHGVLGIMRGLHLSAVKEGVRINVICPWMTSACSLFHFSNSNFLIFLFFLKKTPPQKLCLFESDGQGRTWN